MKSRLLFAILMVSYLILSSVVIICYMDKQNDPDGESVPESTDDSNTDGGIMTTYIGYRDGLIYDFNESTGTLTISSPSADKVAIRDLSEGKIRVGSSDYIDLTQSLRSLIISPGITTSYASQLCYQCVNLTSVSIPGTLTMVGGRYFLGCTSLTNIMLAEGVTTIGQQTFTDCSSLVSVNLPSSITTIGQEAFKQCTSLQEITIPASVTQLNATFTGCRSLNTVVFLGNSMTLGPNPVFDLPFQTPLNLNIYRHGDWYPDITSSGESATLNYYHLYYIDFNTSGNVVRENQKQGFATTLRSISSPAHYHSTGWWSASSGGTKYGDPGQQQTFSADTTLYAQWAIDTYTVALTAIGHGSVSGGGTYDYGSIATIGAFPDTGYKFANWSDGDTNTSRTFTITTNIVLSAFFVMIAPLRIKASGTWVDGVTHVKYNDQWILAKKIYVKENDQWRESK